jgi:hypothetical protein
LLRRGRYGRWKFGIDPVEYVEPTLALRSIRKFSAGWSSGYLNPLVIIRTHEDSVLTRTIKTDIEPTIHDQTGALLCHI